MKSSFRAWEPLYQEKIIFLLKRLDFSTKYVMINKDSNIRKINCGA
jgi:hypothetical protein